MTRRDRRALRVSLLIGLIATAAVVATFLLGGLERFEFMTLDLRFRYANAQSEAGRIVCIDIDDPSINEVGWWPWSRDVQAALIAIPAEAGAQAILVDLTWSERQPPRVTTEDDLALLDSSTVDGQRALEWIYPDTILAAAIRRAGNVYVNYHFAPDLRRNAEFQAAVDALLRDDTPEAQRRIDALLRRRAEQPHRRELRPEEIRTEERPLDQARIVAALQRTPTLQATDVAAKLELSPVFVSQPQIFDACRAVALERIVAAYLQRSPAAAEQPADQIFAALTAELGVDPLDRTPVTRGLRSAIHAVRSYEATVRDPLAPLDAVRAAAVRVEGVTPATYEVAAAARRAGFAVFDEPDIDGVVRRTPILGSHAGRLLSQMAFLLACDLLGVAPDGIRAVDDGLRLTLPDNSQLFVQLDSDHRLMIPWLAEPDWTRQFTHVSARGIVAIQRGRDMQSANTALIRQSMRSLLDLPKFAALREEGRVLDDVEQLEQQLAAEELASSPDVAALRELLAAARAAESEFAGKLEPLLASIASQPGAAAAADPATALHRTIARARAANVALERVNRESLDDLRRLVAGKICLIGYTATSLADMKPIPTSKSAAGVMAHANLLNGMLTGRLVYSASTVLNATIAAAFGLLATALCATLRPRLAFWLAGLFVVGYAAIAGVAVFHNYFFNLALTPVFAAVLLPFIVISTYRYVFIDSERRQLATALGQYTSREIARQMAENPELCRRAESREVTAMFTDLRGFTTISERIGAARTQKVLNVCLGRFTEVMLVHGAMVNKFIGDGIFAFWNPVILPQPDHALRACETAVDLLIALDRLKAEQAAAHGDDIYPEIHLRVGVATGNAIVGPCGSEQKYDYTCIGDSVNLAARLESANKFFGTRILVAGPAREYVGDRFVFRSLGGVRVKGKQNAVPVYELLGRPGEVSADMIAYAERFAAAVARFQARDWRASLDQFDECTKLRPDDPAAQEYIDATAGYIARPPPDDWPGAIELAEK